MVKIVFFGTGGMGQMAHLKNYVILLDVKVVALVEARKKIADAVAKRYDIPNVFYDIDSFIQENIEFDGIVSSQQYRNMITVVPQLLKFGKPLFTEKPLALSIEAAEKLASEAAANNTVHMVGYHKRSDPAMEFGKHLSDEWKESGNFGKLKYIRITMPAGDWVANGFEGVIMSDDPYPSQPGEGNVNYWTDNNINVEYDVFVNYYIHQVNALRFILGEDYTIKYADKSRVMLAAESVSGIPAIVEMSPWTTSIDWQESYLIAFEKAWIQIDLPAPLASNKPGKVTVYEDNGKKPTPITWSPTLPHVHAMKNQAQNFVNYIRNGKCVPCDSFEAVKDLQMAKDYIDLLHK
ncbi:MAG: Gfo/Idh/MocA family protein [Eubacteriales bacterium]